MKNKKNFYFAIYLSVFYTFFLYERSLGINYFAFVISNLFITWNIFEL